ncbi:MULTISPECIES: response regulator transcription factor [unclassified Exiguobacterium]|uniref:response regulator transcription factor n=1 Tax=unclassified Exiguobacterium TaxID=2644629 RepID=UPI001BE6751B|nr:MULTISPECIES: response regulator transcription factor [unclassified Exiguobacterium]
MTKILLVDDDVQIAELIDVYVKNDGYHTTMATDGEMALDLFNQESFDLIILDWMMPRMDGLEFCKRVRQTSQIPILMVSAKVGDMDKILGLTTGVDDYIIKPFNPLELMARIKALLRRSNYNRPSESSSVQAGPFLIDRASHTVTMQDQTIRLTAREFEILYLLAKHKGRVYSSEEIFETVWQEHGVGSNQTVMVHISNIREKLHAVVPHEVIIHTVWGVGYKIET